MVIMNISSHTYLLSSLSIIGDKIKPLNVHLINCQKKVAYIALAIFTIISARLLLAFRSKLKKLPSPNEKKILPKLPETETPPKSSPSLKKILNPENQQIDTSSAIVKEETSDKNLAINNENKSPVTNEEVPTTAKVIEEDVSKKTDSLINHEQDKAKTIDENETDGFGFISDDDEFPDLVEGEDQGVSLPKKTTGKANLVDFEGKLVSVRTFKCMQKLKTLLDASGKTYGNAIDNGDCFWDAFAQGLNKIFGKNVSIQDLRQHVRNEIQRLDKGPDQENWIKNMMKGDFMDTYEDYRDRVAYSCDEMLKKGLASIIWGKEDRDGLILCHLFKVNLTVYSAGCLDEDPAKMNDADNFYSEKRDILADKPYSHTVEIALYPGHFIPVFNKLLA